MLSLGQIHELLNARFTIGQKEICPTTRTLHLQFFCVFDTQKRWTHFQCLPGIHFEICKGSDQDNIEYCTKIVDKKTGAITRVDGPWEYGQRPLQRNSKKDWDIIRAQAKSGDFEPIPADVYIRYYPQLKAIFKDNIAMQHSDRLRGIWIWGPPGNGKTHVAEEIFPDFYPKLINKWFDGYKGQKTVILDDFE